MKKKTLSKILLMLLYLLLLFLSMTCLALGAHYKILALIILAPILLLVSIILGARQLFKQKKYFSMVTSIITVCCVFLSFCLELKYVTKRQELINQYIEISTEYFETDHAERTPQLIEKYDNITNQTLDLSHKSQTMRLIYLGVLLLIVIIDLLALELEKKAKPTPTDPIA